MRYMRFLMAGLLILFVSAAFSQAGGKPDCAELKNHRLQHLNLKDSSAYILLSEDSAIEYHNNGRHTIRARVQWFNDCEYVMTLTEVTIPDFAYHPGDVMYIRIDRIEKDRVYYISTINGNSWEGQLRMVRE